MDGEDDTGDPPAPPLADRRAVLDPVRRGARHPGLPDIADPGADWLFVVPIVLYGVGLLERDGLLILVCHVITLLQVVLGVVLWELIARGFADAYHWCASVLG